MASIIRTKRNLQPALNISNEMPKVSVIVILWNSKKYLKPVMDAVLGQTHKDLEVITVINADDGAREMLQKDYPQVKILDPGKNLGFAGGNNLGIKNSSGEFIQLVNPDLILEPDYIEKMLKAFDNPRVAAATGKLLPYDFSAYAQGFGGSAVAFS